MADDVVFGPFVAETTVADDHPMGIDPRLTSDDGGGPAPVWAASQQLREVVERQDAKPPAADRQLLVTETQRQLATLGLYREITRVLAGPLDPRSTVGLHAILFPGEGRDNTGIKDLNDKVLGYQLTSQFITARQEEIRAVFPPPGANPGPGFFTVGQDYKTAAILAIGKQPDEFAKDLVKLDARLRTRLLELVKKAEQDPDAAARRKAITDLRRTLERDAQYRFDFLFGANSVPARGQAVDVLFRLLTETLKGAGAARFAAKTRSLGTRVSRDIARGRGFDSAEKGHDGRGRVFHTANFLRTLRAVEDIKTMMMKGPDRDSGLDYRAVFVNKVWTATFFTHRKEFFGNPDVVRDVRKRALERPAAREGVKFSFESQKELLELWLVALNLLDFVKDFVSAEYPGTVTRQHVEGLLRLEELLNPAVALDWPRLTTFLTHDLRAAPVVVQGTASEYQFYSHAADQPNQVFFTMDIRDLGVELMAFYEAAQLTIQGRGLTGLELAKATLRATDPIVARKRLTYDSVVDVFRRHYSAAVGPGSAAAAAKAFGTALSTATMPEFGDSIRVMLGGDEVFVAAHPYYATVAHKIVEDLGKITFQGRPLNLRASVAFSSATIARTAAISPFGRFISPEQRKENQRAHDKAMRLGADALGLLKPLERLHRRIELLIDKLEANEKKRDQAPGLRKQLADLRLLELWVRVQRGNSRTLPPAVYRRLRGLLVAGNIAAATATTLVELVDLTGTVVDAGQVTGAAEALAAALLRAVGRDNFHFEGPPVTKMPKWIEKLLDELPDVP
jgi:hypothetical protein